MLEAFEPRVHTRLNSLACAADRVKELVFWSYGANKLSYYQFEQLVRLVKQMSESLTALEVLDREVNNAL